MTENDHILLAYDGSDGAKAAVEAAGRLFPGRGADVVSVWRSVAAPAPVGNISAPTEVIARAFVELSREAEARAEGLAEEGAAAARDGGLRASARAVHCDGNTWATLVRLANENRPAVIVLGSRGRSGIKSALLGSVSTGVTHHSEVPVVVVPSPEATESQGTTDSGRPETAI